LTFVSFFQSTKRKTLLFRKIKSENGYKFRLLEMAGSHTLFSLSPLLLCRVKNCVTYAHTTTRPPITDENPLTSNHQQHVSAQAEATRRRDNHIKIDLTHHAYSQVLLLFLPNLSGARSDVRSQRLQGLSFLPL
jgi:hypothetical protein